MLLSYQELLHLNMKPQRIDELRCSVGDFPFLEVACSGCLPVCFFGGLSHTSKNSSLHKLQPTISNDTFLVWGINVDMKKGL